MFVVLYVHWKVRTGHIRLTYREFSVPVRNVLGGFGPVLWIHMFSILLIVEKFQTHFWKPTKQKSVPRMFWTFGKYLKNVWTNPSFFRVIRMLTWSKKVTWNFKMRPLRIMWYLKMFFISYKTKFLCKCII